METLRLTKVESLRFGDQIGEFTYRSFWDRKGIVYVYKGEELLEFSPTRVLGWLDMVMVNRPSLADARALSKRMGWHCDREEPVEA